MIRSGVGGSEELSNIRGVGIRLVWFKSCHAGDQWADIGRSEYTVEDLLIIDV